jgi:hypothetical protein
MSIDYLIGTVFSRIPSEYIKNCISGQRQVIYDVLYRFRSKLSILGQSDFSDKARVSGDVAEYLILAIRK